MKSSSPSRVRFGAFELDLRSGELHPLEAEPGMRAVVLQEQPFQVLRLLIERNGEVATREEIRKSLWPNDTAVDFNHSINVAIGTLRRVLRDSTEEPKYIETVARRGYRLIAPTEWVSNGEESSVVEADPGDNGESSQLGLLEGAGLVGKKVSHYRVLQVIGGGGMGMVYQAEDLKLARRVALKFLPEELASDPLSLRRFEREAQTASSLNHANICTIHAIDEYEGQPFIAMELLEGETLRDRLAASGARALPLGDLLEIAGQVCQGLAAAHGKGIIHRDIKPANIFLTRQGPVKILDFGLAKLAASVDQEEHLHLSPNTRKSSDHQGSAAVQEADPSLTHTGMAIGTAGYMSPEQIKKERLDARTDLFSFGLVLYEMATGQRAFSGETSEALHDAILHQIPAAAHTLNAAVPPGLESMLATALEKDRARRYQSAAEMGADLEALGSQKGRWLWDWKWVAAVVLLLAAATAGAWFLWRSHTAFRLAVNDTVVLADLSNQTSDPIFDDALNTALRVEFEQTPFVNILAADKVRGTLKTLAGSEDAKLTPEKARDVCLRTNSRAVIAGSIADEGNHFRVELQAIECSSGKAFARVSRDVANRNEIVHALGLSGVQLRSKAGEPRASVARFSKPLEEATSSSLEALQLLADGYRHHSARDDHAASYYQRAIELDSKMALAYVGLGAFYQNVGEMALASAAEKRAYELRDRLTGPARYLTETLYYDVGTGQLEKAFPVHEQWVQTFPLDVRAHINFSYLLSVLGQYQRAVDEAREAVRLLPSIATYSLLITGNIFADRPDEAKAAFLEAEAHGTLPDTLHTFRHLVAFLEQDKAVTREQLGWAMEHSGDAVLYGEAGAEAYYGHFRSATQWFDRAQHADQRPGSEKMGDAVDFAMQQVEVGKTANPEELSQSAPSRDARIALALFFARTGKIEQAQQLAAAVDRELPLDTMAQNYALPTIRASIHLQQNDPAAAIRSLQPAVKYDLASPLCFNPLYPAYLRGLAYLQLHNGPMAAAEFQKLIDHPGLVGRFVTGSLARLQLGRAQAMAGDRVGARRSYEEFLRLWQDADGDIPVYRQARNEYVKLN
jgi:DNA-binding winged helix-turn-helix (wHTH) protein/tRNA A-37 threonylcarbamoyl transferase component Bud32/tetratricopeptide (TPR) repeat protein